MENQKKLVIASLAILMCSNVLLYAQSVCVHSFKDNSSNIKSTAFKSVVLSNGDLVAAGYRKVNGYPKIVVDRYSFATCSIVATYTLPYYSGPPATAPMQLLVNNNDFIGIRYFDTNAPGFNHFIVLDSNLNLVSTLVLGNSVTNRLMAFTSDGGVVLTLLTSAPSYGEQLKVRRVLANDLNNTVWNTIVNFPNAGVRMISDIKTDSINGLY